jgi:hypothetical protein
VPTQITRRPNTSKSFTLALADVGSLPDEVVERLYSKCPDATVSQRDGAVYVSFDRASQSLASAVVRAIRDVQKLGLGVDRIIADELVSASDVAARINRSRESVRLLIEGERGPGDFPPPAEVVGKQRFWRWRDVDRWFCTYESKALAETSFDAFAAAVNGLLRAGREVRHLPTEQAKAVRDLAREEALLSR